MTSLYKSLKTGRIVGVQVNPEPAGSPRYRMLFHLPFLGLGVPKSELEALLDKHGEGV